MEYAATRHGGAAPVPLLRGDRPPRQLHRRGEEPSRHPVPAQRAGDATRARPRVPPVRSRPAWGQADAGGRGARQPCRAVAAALARHRAVGGALGSAAANAAAGRADRDADPELDPGAARRLRARRTRTSRCWSTTSTRQRPSCESTPADSTSGSWASATRRSSRRRRPGSRSTKLLEEDFVLLVPADHRLASFDRVPLAQLRDERAIAFLRSSALRRVTNELLDRERVSMRTTIESGRLDIAVRMVGVGLGVCLLPRTTALLAQAADVRVVELDAADPPKRLLLALHRDDNPNAGAQRGARRGDPNAHRCDDRGRPGTRRNATGLGSAWSCAPEVRACGAGPRIATRDPRRSDPTGAGYARAHGRDPGARDTAGNDGRLLEPRLPAALGRPDDLVPRRRGVRRRARLACHRADGRGELARPRLRDRVGRRRC